MDSSFCKGLETAAYTKTKRWTTRRLWGFVLPDIISLNCGGVLARAKSTSHASHTAHTSHSTHASSKEGFKKIKWIRLHGQPFIAHCQTLLGDQNCGLKKLQKELELGSEDTHRIGTSSTTTCSSLHACLSILVIQWPFSII
jgi:hypothetical protein